MFKDLFDGVKQAEIAYLRLEQKFNRAQASAEYWENKFNELRRNPKKYASKKTVKISFPEYTYSLDDILGFEVV